MKAIIWNWRKIPTDALFHLQYGSEVQKATVMYVAAGKGYFDTYELPAESLEEVFYKLNMDHPEDYKNRSLSVGDLVIDNDGQFWVCMSAGWNKLEYMNLPGVIDAIKGHIR